MATEFNEQTLGNALPRILELVANTADLNEWYEQVGIDREFLYAVAGLLQTQREIHPSSFVLGVALAWETSRVPDES